MNQFTHTPVRNIPSNNFDLSHHVSLTCDAGFIIPIECAEVLPKDTHYYSNKIFTRLMPMVSPAYAKLDVTVITGFVPLRLIWPNSEKFFANPVPDANTPVAPHFNNIAPDIGSLADYLGVPTRQYRSDDGTIKNQFTTISDVSALPFAAYQKFYSDWFRDENLINNAQPTFTPLADGVQSYSGSVTGLGTLRKRAWRHDYFTSNLPFAQKGEAVEIPMGSFAPIVYDNPLNTKTGFWRGTGASFPSGDSNMLFRESGTPDNMAPTASSTAGLVNYDPNDTLKADLSSASAITINSLRWATKLQEFLEKNARGGTRYTEIVRQHFGQVSSDARLQRAEFLGFAVNPITISEVLQTSPSAPTTTPLGELAGHGISYGTSRKLVYHAEEHGYFLTMLSIRPRSSYMQGLPRMFSRKSPLDYAWPTFAQLGEQETKNKELFATGTSADEQTFGYLPRYAEYRYMEDRVSGQMRTSYAHWHMTRIFDAAPALNQSFVECTPTKRIFAVNAPGSHSYLLSINHDHKVRRALPKFGIPAL